MVTRVLLADCMGVSFFWGGGGGGGGVAGKASLFIFSHFILYRYRDIKLLIMIWSYRPPLLASKFIFIALFMYSGNLCFTLTSNGWLLGCSGWLLGCC